MIIKRDELDRIILENIKRTINEDTKEGEFNDEYLEKQQKNRPAEKGLVAKGIGKSAAAGVGGYMGANFFGGALNMSTAAANGWGMVLGGIGLGMIAARCIENAIALNKVKKLEFPKRPGPALEYAKYAAAERAVAQKDCLTLQQNIKNAIIAYNLVFNEQKTWENVQGELHGQKAKFHDRGKQETVDVDFGRNFNDLNTGQNENRKHGKLVEASQPSQQLLSVDEYKRQFQGKSSDEAWEEIKGIGMAYISVYGTWFQWTRYINVLVYKYKKFGLTWDAVMKSNTTNGRDSIINAFKSKYFGENETGYQGKQSKNRRTNEVATCVVINDNYSFTTAQNADRYIVLQDKKDNAFYAIPRNIFNNVTIPQKGETWNMVKMSNFMNRPKKTQQGGIIYTVQFTASDVQQFLQKV